MDLTAHQIDLIDAFLRGELEANALDEFKLLVETNSVFKEELEQKRSLQTTMMRKGNKDLKQLLKDQEQKPRIKPEQKPSPIFRWISMAASLLILVGILSFFYNPSQDSEYRELYAENFTVYPNDYVRIERGASESSEINSIFNDYSSQEFEKTIKGIDAILNSKGEADDKLSFYKGVSLMGLENFEEASKIFEQLKKSDIKDYQNQIAWYSALTQLALENPDKAKVDLARIISSDNDFRKKSAQELLSKMEK